MSAATSTILGIAALAVSAGGAAYAGVSASNASDDAKKQNAKDLKSTNKTNLRLFREGRGMPNEFGDVSSVLPYYADEEKLGADAMSYYQAMRASEGTPAEQIARYRESIGRYRPMIEAGDRDLAGIYSGSVTDEELAAARPVFGARSALAETQSEGIMEGLSARLNTLSADRARQGYSGGSSFDTNRALASTIMARQAAAGARGGANLANAEQEFGLRLGGINRRLSAMDAPFQRAGQLGQFESLPGQLAGQSFKQSMSPFEFFRISPNAYQAPQPYPVQPGIGMGQIIGAGLGAAGSTLGNYYMNKQLLDQINARNSMATNYGGVSNWSGLSAGQQSAYNSALASGAQWSYDNPGPWE